jgi:hypothetical protein
MRLRSKSLQAVEQTRPYELCVLRSILSPHSLFHQLSTVYDKKIFVKVYLRVCGSVTLGANDA